MSFVFLFIIAVLTHRFALHRAFMNKRSGALGDSFDRARKGD